MIEEKTAAKPVNFAQCFLKWVFYRKPKSSGRVFILGPAPALEKINV